MFATKKCVFKEKLRCDALDIKVWNLVHKQDLCMIQKMTRESNVLILKRLHLLDISCGTWEADQKCDQLDNGLDTRWY